MLNEEQLKTFFHEGDHFARLIGAELIEIKEGYARARMLVTDKHLNGAGTCQGGALFTLADLAFAGAVNSHGQLTVSTSSNITYFRPATLGYVYAEAVETVNHHRMPSAEVRLTDEAGNLIAIFTSSGYRKKETINNESPLYKN